MTAAGETHVRRWAAHPWRARAVRLLVYSLPIAASIGFVQLVTSLTGVPTSSLWAFLAWWLGISALATVVVSLGYASTKRLLPLGALLGLSLVFPDEAPSRFKIALSAGTVESLGERLRRASEAPTAQESAEILLQLVAALDMHDPLTRGHADRVRAYSYSLGRQLGLQGDDLDHLNWAALSHGRMRLVMGPVSWLSHAPILARLPLTPSFTAALGGLASLAAATTTGIVAPHAAAQVNPARPHVKPAHALVAHHSAQAHVHR